KPDVIKGQSSKWGGDAEKVSALIRGGLPRVPIGTERIERSLSAVQKSAEAIVVGGVTAIRGEQGNLFTGRRAERQAG
ncbi:MAG: hypothetical protein Q8R28_15760, partial [Dehalococcoidia bacterium]|nr:hypothetical protein [Dehalococcoidia bacterium]